MQDQSDIYQKCQCPKCGKRLRNPQELKCRHIVCAECLEIILRNHRNNARCPDSKCEQPLQEYSIEQYTYLPLSHPVSRLLKTFDDVNRCEACAKFTTVTRCSQCSKEYCGECSMTHEQEHQRQQSGSQMKSREISSPTQSSSEGDNGLDNFSDEEIRILESVKRYLSENEYQNFVNTAIAYLDGAISTGSASSGRSSSSTINARPEFPTESEAYDWFQHESFSIDDIVNGDLERVKKLLRLGFIPRRYQLRMARLALRKENSVVCLQTGAGKTFVAGIVAKYFYILAQRYKNSNNLSTGSSRFKAVFLVPLRTLIEQQCAAFKTVFSDQPETLLKTIDNQAAERFKHLYEQFDIFFFTVQKFANFIEAKHVDLSMFDLIIIDECHHCYADHPINSMMRRYHRLKSKGYKVPQIMALTASVGTNKGNAFDHLVALCANLDCINVCAVERGAEEDELRQMTNTPLADTILPVPKEENDTIANYLKETVMKSIAQRLAYETSQIGTQMFESYLVTNQQKAFTTTDREAIIGCHYLLYLNRFLLYYDDLPLKQCMTRLETDIEQSKPTHCEEFETFCRSKLTGFRQLVTKESQRTNPVKKKLQKLVQMITQLHEPNCRGLILVRTKFHTVAIEEFLNNNPDLTQHKIVTGRLTGQGSADELCLPSGKQMTVLNDFRKGTINLLVATDVAQEGLDVAECSYVLRYEFVSNEIGTVQSRGRARAAQSKCFLITEALSLNFQREHENREKESEMKKALDELRKKGAEEFRTLVRKKQGDLLNDLNQSDAQQASASPSASGKESSAKKIHCRFCDTYLCSGSSLRLQGTTVICVDQEFERLVRPPSSAGAKFMCPKSTCHRELGVVILLTGSVPAYALHITSLKFLFSSNDQLPQFYKKWSQYHGDIKQY